MNTKLNTYVSVNLKSKSTFKLKWPTKVTNQACEFTEIAVKDNSMGDKGPFKIPWNFWYAVYYMHQFKSKRQLAQRYICCNICYHILCQWSVRSFNRFKFSSSWILVTKWNSKVILNLKLVNFLYFIFEKLFVKTRKMICYEEKMKPFNIQVLVNAEWLMWERIELNDAIWWQFC